jgi:outer membrane receptor protein involved in Fe transport
MIPALLLASASVSAAEPPKEPTGEIVVTGERVARTARETASSVAVIDRAAIDAMPAPDRLEQLLQTVPNVQLGSGGEGPTIRGQDSTGVVRDLPAFLGGTRPRTTIQVDGRPITYYELAFGLASIWDAHQVEVFRSPQTTTQGRNSIGGAIFITTREPTFEWEGSARAILGDFATRQASVAASGPIVADQLAFRLSGDIRRSRTASEITSAAVGIDPNEDRYSVVRLKLRAEPEALPGSRLDLNYVHNSSQMPQFEGIEQPFEERKNPNATYGTFRINVDSVTARFLQRLSARLEGRVTASYGDAHSQRFAPRGLGEAMIDSRDFSLEPIVEWRPASSVHLVTGANWLTSKLDQTIDVSAQQFGIGNFADDQESLGIFGEANLTLAERLTATAGLRYQHDRQRRSGAMQGGRTNLFVDYDEAFSAWLPKLSLAYDVTPEVRVGLLAQRAYNPGGLTINTQRFRVDTFEAETLWDFEAFARATLPGTRLSVSANLFRYEMRNAQRVQNIAFALANGQIAFAAEVDNAPRAWTHGLEIEAQWLPSLRFKLRGGLGLLDTRVTRTIEPSDPLLGKEFQRSPHLTGFLAATLRPLANLVIDVQGRMNTRYLSDDYETASRRIPGSTTVDGKISWTQRQLEVFGYVRNLLDEFHLTYKLAPALGLATAGDPRELGVGVQARF